MSEARSPSTVMELSPSEAAAAAAMELSPRAAAAAAATAQHDECVRTVRLAFDGVPVGSGPDHGCGGQGSPATEMTYGEMTWKGMRTLHDALRLLDDDVVYDLGSGVGKFVLYTALRASCASSTGVEVGIKRHASAERGCQQLASLLAQSGEAPIGRCTSKARLRLGLEPSQPQREPAERRRCASFAAVLGDITDRACIYRDATIVVLCNIMFGAGINGRVLANLLTRCPRQT